MRSSTTDTTQGQAAPCAILRIFRVTQITGLSRTTIWRLERDGKFPRRVRLSERIVGFKEADVHRWIEERKTA
jgi:predicted DNA-binding transcriptional regulator AlpA